LGDGSDPEVLVDARGWSQARLDETSISALDPETQREAPLIKRDFASEMDRVKELVEVLGGDGQLQALYAAAGV